MNISVCRAKIHRARLTQCDLHYEGSLAIDNDILDAVCLYPYEKILVVNATNGNRLETYAIPAPRGSKIFSLNGAAAHLGNVGDIVTIMAFGTCDEKEAKTYTLKVAVMNEKNEIVELKGRISY